MNINTIEVNVENNDVVLNDKDLEAQYTPKQIGSVLNRLVKQREDWESNAYRISNEILYSILGECYALDWEISKTKEGAKKLRDEVNTYAKSLGYTFKDGTPMLNRIIRTVFGNVHRSRISTYSLVLREAKTKSVAIADIPSFIETAGGLQEIRLSKSQTYKSPKAKADTAQKSIEKRDKLAVVKTEALSKLVTPERIGEHCLLLAIQEADASFTVKSLVTATGAVNAALTAIYQEEKAEAARQEKERLEAIKVEVEAAQQKLAA